MSKPLLDIRNLSVDYVTDGGVARAVNDVSLSIFAGETVGLAGESGCGKSTLAFSIANLHGAPAVISEGAILFEGRDILRMDPDELRSVRWAEVSMVFQSAMNALNPVITVGEQLVDVVCAHRKVGYSEARSLAEDALELVGIHRTRFDSYAHQLSGGMRQRVVIAIALILQPKLIVMDEPTTALDVVVEREIMDQLYELKDRLGFAILFISHDLGLMGEITDRIGVMYAGKLVEIGDTSTIMAAPSHPYTQGLLASFPSIHGPKVRLEGIPGNPLNLLEVPEGCFFRDRCAKRVGQCLHTQPTLTPVNKSERHLVSCLEVRS